MAGLSGARCRLRESVPPRLCVELAQERRPSFGDLCSGGAFAEFPPGDGTGSDVELAGYFGRGQSRGFADDAGAAGAGEATNPNDCLNVDHYDKNNDSS